MKKTSRVHRMRERSRLYYEKPDEPPWNRVSPAVFTYWTGQRQLKRAVKRFHYPGVYWNPKTWHNQ